MQHTQQDVSSSDDAYAALAARRAAPVAGLIVAVKTTGIYCRFGCPARTPKRENVVFYPDSAAARAAGFRACKRCKPDAQTADNDLLTRAYRLLEREGAMPLSRLAQRLDAAAAELARLFKQSTGLSARQLDEARRFKTLQHELSTGTPVTEAIYAAGFGGPRRVYEMGATTLGMTPARYARGGAGLTIGYVVRPTILGALLVAATDKGVCQVMVASSQDELEMILRARFHAATLVADADLGDAVTAIIGYLEGQMPLPTLPLDIQATAFEARVWAALTRIPAGSTATYGDLAQEIGSPGAARAVGRACGANPVAILIPCHRAVAASGALTGYRWGLAVKEKLLAIEGRH